MLSVIDDFLLLSGINPISSGFLTIKIPGGITPMINTIMPKNIQAEGQFSDTIIDLAINGISASPRP